MLRNLPAVVGGGLGFYVVDAGGVVVEHEGPDEVVGFRLAGDRLEVQVDPERTWREAPGAGTGHRVVLTFDAGAEPSLGPFLATIFRGLAEREQLKQDMESMYSSSLALLEEVSMVGEMLPKLPLGESELDVVRTGLEALVVAASVEGAIFVRYHADREQAEVLLYLQADTGVVEDYAGERFVTDGFAWEAIHSDGALLVKVPDGGALGADGSPERQARREMVGVPVRFGGSEKPVNLGALLLLDKRANSYSTTDRFGSQDTKLATSVATMLGSVLGTRKVAELGNELRLAHSLHRQILPDRYPTVPGFEFAGDSVSPGAVGGDYYDFLELADGRTLCVVADVSGHNLASCLVMVGARAALRVLATSTTDTAEVFDQLAASLFPDLSRTELFITAVGAAIEPTSKTLELVNAGHNPTMLYRAATGEIEEILAPDTVVGFLPAPKHDVARRDLAPGDVVLLYTDGVTEAADRAGQFFGEERLRALLTRVVDRSAQEILDEIYATVDRWAGEDEEGDDISVMVIKVN